MLEEIAEMWELISQLVSRSKQSAACILRLVEYCLQSSALAGAQAIQKILLPMLMAVRRIDFLNSEITV